MGWYFRRSIRLGPLGLNLRKSRLGASVGVKGARVGVDAKGKGYVAGGRDGIYFRERLSAPSEQGPTPASSGPGLLWPILTIAAGLLVALAILGTL
jgi:hypothetical protein